MKAMQEQAQMRQSAAAEKVAEAMAAAKVGDAPSTVTPLPSLREEVEAQPASPEATASSMQVAQQHTQRAGERAMRLLPCCYLLLESVIEVLAEDFAMQVRSSWHLFVTSYTQNQWRSLITCLLACLHTGFRISFPLSLEMDIVL
jgi:hypothetical protein